MMKCPLDERWTVLVRQAEDHSQASLEAVEARAATLEAQAGEDLWEQVLVVDALRRRLVLRFHEQTEKQDGAYWGCAGCRHFRPVPETDMGLCMAEAPRVVEGVEVCDIWDPLPGGGSRRNVVC